MNMGYEDTRLQKLFGVENKIISPRQQPFTLQFQFQMPARALYATSPLWDASRHDPPFLIKEDSDAAFVLERYPYRPVPFQEFGLALSNLHALNAIQIKPSYLKEGIDRSALEDSIEDMGVTYLLCKGVYMRFRKDSDEKQPIHTMVMLGDAQDIVALAGSVQLPHPFDKSLYPYRHLFKDTRLCPLPVLM